MGRNRVLELRESMTWRPVLGASSTVLREILEAKKPLNSACIRREELVGLERVVAVENRHAVPLCGDANQCRWATQCGGAQGWVTLDDRTR
jgi:hypothetical protein